MTDCVSCNKNTKTTCPFRMSDGRNFTDYTPKCTYAAYQQQQNKFKSNYEQRQYLIHNANKLMSDEIKMAERKLDCSGCNPSKVNTMLPEQNMVECNKRTCSFKPINPNGLGTGRKYA